MKKILEALPQIKNFLLKNEGMSQTVVKNTFWLSISELAGRALRIIIIIYAARVLGAAGWGTFAYLTSLAAVFTIFSDIGISSVVVREVTKSPEREGVYFSTAFAVKFVLTLVSLAILVFLTPLFTGIPISQTLLGLVGLLFVFDSLRRFSTSLFRAREKMEREAAVNVLTQTSIVVAGFIALSLSQTPESLGAAYATGAGIGFLAAAYLLRDNIKKLFVGFDKTLVASIIKDAWPLSFGAIFGMLLVNIDTVMIGWFKSAEEVGFYSAAQKPISMLYILPTLIVGGVFPVLAKFAYKNPDGFRKVFEKSLGLIAMVAFPLAIGIMLTSGEIISLVYGSEYAAAAPSLRILGLTIITAFPVSIIIHGVFAHNKQTSLVPLWISGATLNIVLNLILIPRNGISGAAWASLITQIIINGLIWLKMKKINSFNIFQKLPVILLATFMMSVATIIGKLLDIHILIIIPIAVAAYFGSLAFSGERVLDEILGRKKVTDI